MASQLERITTLEEQVRTLRKSSSVFRKTALSVFSILLVPGTVWFVWWVTTSITAIKQQLADGGNKQLVSELQSPQSPQQLQANLLTVVAQVQTARVERKSPNFQKTSSLSAGVADVLEHDPTLPLAWQAASELVSYRSDVPRKKYLGHGAVMSQWGNEVAESNADIPADQPLPDCSGRHVMLEVQGAITPQTQDVPLSVPQLRNCRLDLDKVGKGEMPTWLGTAALACLGCDVYYSGGPIPLLISGTRTLEFVDCRFNVAVTPASPTPSKRLVEMLLANSNSQTGTLTSSPG